ncbi:rRNA-processing protein fcf2-like [Dendronephthya gigantea]|uniref:rRNA-processing protein fcf2-like n=1 Tax=Dendronephthya gigantea TaxID=151771 RepID=UPI001069CC25|nr:rRNA-processing protein fcf2-like [Dendronephthya gigantea]
MVRRSARLRNKNPDGNADEECEDLSVKSGQETLEMLVQRTYSFIKERMENREKSSRCDAVIQKEDTQKKAEDFIRISSGVKDNVSDCHTLASELDPGLDPNKLYFKMDQSNSKAIPCISKHLPQFDEKQIMRKCVISSDFEKKETAPKYHITHHAMKKQRKNDRERSAGQNWFNMPAPEMTQELRRDLNILRMRNVLDPKRHYKKNSSKKLPKYFQLGTVVSSAAEFYSSRLPKRERKKTIVESLLADAEFRRYNKRKFFEIQASKERGKKGFYRRTKRKRR